MCVRHGTSLPEPPAPVPASAALALASPLVAPLALQHFSFLVSEPAFPPWFGPAAPVRPVRQRPPPPANCLPGNGDRIPRPEEVSSYSCASPPSATSRMDSSSTVLPGTMTVSLTLSPSRKRMNRSRTETFRTLTAPLFTGFFETRICNVCFISSPLLSEGRYRDVLQHTEIGRLF